MHRRAKWQLHVTLVLAMTFLQFGARTAFANDCIATALGDNTSVSRDEEEMISACEYSEADCNVRKGEKVDVEAIVVWPSYDMHHLFILDKKGRCFSSDHFRFSEDCDPPVRVKDGC